MTWGVVVVGVSLLLASLVLLALHFAAWRRVDHGGLADREREFARRQFRRRLQISGMLGVVGLLMLTTLWAEETSMQLVLWLAMLFALLWVMLMAMIDFWASRSHFGRDQAVTAAEIEILKREIKRCQDEQRQ